MIIFIIFIFFIYSTIIIIKLCIIPLGVAGGAVPVEQRRCGQPAGCGPRLLQLVQADAGPCVSQAVDMSAEMLMSCVYICQFEVEYDLILASER